MKRILLPAVVFLALAVPMQSASASNQCPRGAMTTACIDAIEDTTSLGEQLAQCYRELGAEYHGETSVWDPVNRRWKKGVPGKGTNYQDKKDDCYIILRKVMKAMPDLMDETADTSIRKTLHRTLKAWAPDS